MGGGGVKKDAAWQQPWLTPTYLLAGNLEHADMSDDIGSGSPVGWTYMHLLPVCMGVFFYVAAYNQSAC